MAQSNAFLAFAFALIVVQILAVAWEKLFGRTRATKTTYFTALGVEMVVILAAVTGHITGRW